MTLDEFWELVHVSRRNDPEEHSDRLANRLTKLPLAEILSFGRLWYDFEVEAYNWNLWGAAYLINGGCSDDGFEYFRDWLILQGREVFAASVRDPDSLADYLEGAGEVEAECNPAFDAYCAVSDREDYHEALEKAYPDLPEYPDLGQPWDFDDSEEMLKRYPKLYATYMNDFAE